MSIKCGYCKERHDSVEQVKACASGEATGTVIAPPQPQQGTFECVACDRAKANGTTPYSHPCPNAEFVSAPVPQADRWHSMPSTSHGNGNPFRGGRSVASTGEALATDKQVRFIEKLLAERPSLADTITAPAALTKRAASLVIDNLLKQPKESKTSHHPTTEPVADITDGFYVDVDGKNIYKVQVAVHGSGSLYAKMFDNETTGFNYVSGLVTTVRKGVAAGTIEKLTLERAKELGKLYGMCCRCGRTLTNEDSIEAGIGPICAGKGF